MSNDLDIQEFNEETPLPESPKREEQIGKPEMEDAEPVEDE